MSLAPKHESNPLNHALLQTGVNQEVERGQLLPFEPATKAPPSAERVAQLEKEVTALRREVWKLRREVAHHEVLLRNFAVREQSLRKTLIETVTGSSYDFQEPVVQEQALSQVIKALLGPAQD